METTSRSSSLSSASNSPLSKQQQVRRPVAGDLVDHRRDDDGAAERKPRRLRRCLNRGVPEGRGEGAPAVPGPDDEADRVIFFLMFLKCKREEVEVEKKKERAKDRWRSQFSFSLFLSPSFFETKSRLYIRFFSLFFPASRAKACLLLRVACLEREPERSGSKRKRDRRRSFFNRFFNRRRHHPTRLLFFYCSKAPLLIF